MKEEYKGYTIEYCEWNKYFIAKIGDTDYSNSDLTKVKKRIDDLDKENFKRTQVLYRSGWKDSKFDALTVTSESFERDDLFVWTISQNKTRSKHSAKILFMDTLDNREKVAQIKELEEKIKVLEHAVGDVVESMEKYQPQTKKEKLSE